MAITAISLPADVSMVYNPLYFNVSSNQIAQPNFQYLFNLYSGTSLTNPVASVNLLPRPDGTCLFNPARILESWVSADQGIQGITAIYPSQNMLKEYTLDIGEAYGGSIYTGSTYYSEFVLNGVQQYKDLPSWNAGNYANYIVADTPSTTIKFLTNQPRSGVLTLLTDIGTLTWAGYRPFEMRVSIQGSGPFTTSSFLYNISITSSTTGNTYHIPCGPAQLNPLIGSHKIDSGTTSYQIYLYDAINGQLTEAITYVIDTDCSKYQNMRIQFLNPYGAWDYVNFRMVSTETINVTKRTLYKKTLPYNYTVGAREQTQIDLDGYETYKVTSNWVNNAYSDWFKELFRSQQVNLIQSDGTALPVNIVETENLVQKTINNGLLQYIFNFNTAYSINSQRG